MTKRKISYEQDLALAAGRLTARANQRRRTRARAEAEALAAERAKALAEHAHGWKNWEYDFDAMTETRECRVCGETETRPDHLVTQGGDMAQYPETKLDRSVQRAIDKVNRDYLNDPEAQARDLEIGTLWRRTFEAQDKGFVQKTDDRGYPTETLEEFCQRAGT